MSPRYTVNTSPIPRPAMNNRSTSSFRWRSTSIIRRSPPSGSGDFAELGEHALLPSHGRADLVEREHVQALDRRDRIRDGRAEPFEERIGTEAPGREQMADDLAVL